MAQAVQGIFRLAVLIDDARLDLRRYETSDNNVGAARWSLFG